MYILSYLALRGLDSIEDNMNYHKEKKIILLENFHNYFLIDNWSIANVGDSVDYPYI